MSVEYQIRHMKQDVEYMNNITQSTLQTLGDAANPDQLKQLDCIFRNLSGEMAKYEEAIRVSSALLRNARGSQAQIQAAIEKLVSELEDKDFASDKAKEAFKTNEEYKTFVEKHRSKESSIGAGMDIDDDLAVVNDGPSNGAQLKDPYSQLPLAKEQESGKYPIAMPCGHIYNWSMIMERKTQKNKTTWMLEKCCVGGCPAAKADWSRVDRTKLKECTKTKSAIQRRDRGLSQAQESEVDSTLIEDL